MIINKKVFMRHQPHQVAKKMSASLAEVGKEKQLSVVPNKGNTRICRDITSAPS